MGLTPEQVSFLGSKMTGLTGFEPVTNGAVREPALETAHSCQLYQLSYSPTKTLQKYALFAA